MFLVFFILICLLILYATRLQPLVVDNYDFGSDCPNYIIYPKSKNFDIIFTNPINGDSFHELYITSFNTDLPLNIRVMNYKSAQETFIAPSNYLGLFTPDSMIGHKVRIYSDKFISSLTLNMGNFC